MRTEPQNKPQRAVGYVRVSTDEQAKHGISLPDQRDRIRKYASSHGLELVDLITDDGISGYKPLAKRPGGARLTTLVKRGQVDAVLVIDLDRLFRSSADQGNTLEAWKRLRVKIHEANGPIDNETASGKLSAGVRGQINQYFRDVISEKTQAAMKRKRSWGEKTGGGVPFGFNVKNGRLVKNAIEARTASKIARWRSGGLTLREIAARLNSQGLRTKQGANWKAIQVSRAIRNAERFGTV